MGRPAAAGGWGGDAYLTRLPYPAASPRRQEPPVLTANRPQAAPPREEFLGDMYLRLERLEAEVRRLRESAERPGTEVFEAQDWDAPDAGRSLHEDGSNTETRPEIDLNALTPPSNPWPAPRPSPRDTPWPTSAPDHGAPEAVPAVEALDLAGDRSAGAMLTLGRAAAGVAHDLNDLLTAILGSAGLLRERLDADPDGRDLASDIITAAEHAGALCRNLVGVARPSFGTPARTDLTRQVTTYRRLLGKLAGAHVEVRFDLADDLPPAEIPPAEFAQVLLNLAQNAAEALGPAGGTLTIATSAETVAAGRHVVLTVSDRGPGVGLNRDAASLRDLCRPGVAPRPDALGLTVVADILTRHGGHLTLEADAATGTSLRVAFRAAS